MTAHQFKDALKRNGFRECMLGWIDATDENDKNIYMGVVRNDGSILRRQTIRYLIEQREKKTRYV